VISSQSFEDFEWRGNPERSKAQDDDSFHIREMRLN
jgi:hypothetical protein